MALRRTKGKEQDGQRAGVATSGVVIAGDHPDALELMGRILAAAGEPIELIDDKASAIATAVASPHRAVVVAFRGGHSGNLAVVDTIRRHPDAAVRTTPIVVIADNEKNVTFTWQAGIDEHLVWPVHANDLLAKVEAAMSRSSSEREAHRRNELRRAQAGPTADPDGG